MNTVKATGVGLTLLWILSIGCHNPHGQIFRQAANPQRGFNFPYLLFLPEHMDKTQELTLIVEPNNTGFVSDDFGDHEDGAMQMIENFGHIGKYLADSLSYPLMVPVFPRSKEQWTIYTHALDRDAIETNENTIKRIDLQLISMVADAKEVLGKMGFSVDEKIVMAGFSASATFTNRFTFLHPERIKLSIAGGLNGILILPIQELNGSPLEYPLGTHDFNKILKDSLDMMSLRQIPQFLFMGATDENDAAAYGDAYDNDERDIIYTNFGKDMAGRWLFCGRMYEKAFERVEIKTYDKTGHTITDEIRSDILEFARKWTQENGRQN